MKHDFLLPLQGSLMRASLGAIVAIGLAGAAIGQEAEAAPVEGGLVTAEQAARGDALYEQRCATCHGADIVDSFASYPNAALFFGYVSTAMPADAPGSMPPQQYADIIAYLMTEIGQPIGTEEVAADQAALAEISPAAIKAANAEGDQ